MLRDRCTALYDLASLFRARRNTFDKWSGKNRKTNWHGAVSSPLNLPCLKEVSQNCFDFAAVNIENELVSQTCFVFEVVKFTKLEEVSKTCCALILSSSKTEEISQNSFVFKLADKQIKRGKLMRHNYNCNCKCTTVLLPKRLQIYTTLQHTNYTTLH